MTGKRGLVRKSGRERQCKSSFTDDKNEMAHGKGRQCWLLEL